MSDLTRRHVVGSLVALTCASTWPPVECLPACHLELSRLHTIAGRNAPAIARWLLSRWHQALRQAIVAFPEIGGAAVVRVSVGECATVEGVEEALLRALWDAALPWEAFRGAARVWVLVESLEATDTDFLRRVATAETRAGEVLVATGSRRRPGFRVTVVAVLRQ